MMMNRFIRLVACFLLCIFAITACAAKEPEAAAGGLYEPDTSVALPAIVAFSMEKAVPGLADAQVRPNSVFVAVDESLRVFGETGEAVAPGLGDFLASMKSMIPGLYVKTEGAAQALLGYLKENGRQDVMVAVSPENGPLLQQIKKELPGVRGLMDFSAEQQAWAKQELAAAVARANESGAKIMLLSAKTATREAVQYLQGRLMTVWVRVDDSQKEILTQLTYGVNGLMTGDYQAVYGALSLFKADAPILLRAPLVVGHRGLPNGYIENTLRSEIAAAQAGADVLEYDIYLSADGEIFVIHDKTLQRLFNRGDVQDVEAMTLAQLQSIPFDSDSANGVQKKNHTPAKDASAGAISVLPEDRIPSLREIFEAFQNDEIYHFVEIKSQNPAIVDALKALAMEWGMDGRMAVISFNVPILRAMAEQWPQMSVGALGYDDARGRNTKRGKRLDPEQEVPYENHANMVKDAAGDASQAAQALGGVVGLYNATYNPSHASVSYETIKAARHYGMTAWPWTYNDPAVFARDYLFGMYGLTTNFTTWASALPVAFTAVDGTAKLGEALAAEDIFSPSLKTLAGETYSPEKIEWVLASEQELWQEEAEERVAKAAGECLVLLRARIPLMLDGKDYGAFYLYANPVTLRVTE